MSKNCREFIEYDESYGVPWHPVNCPNCGRWLKWESYQGKFTCSKGCDLITITDGWGATVGKVCANPIHSYTERMREEK